jgi:hypothetical protein
MASKPGSLRRCDAAYNSIRKWPHGVNINDSPVTINCFANPIYNEKEHEITVLRKQQITEYISQMVETSAVRADFKGQSLGDFGTKTLTASLPSYV